MRRRFWTKTDDAKNLKLVVVDESDDEILKTTHTICFFWPASFFDVGFTDDDVKTAHIPTGLTRCANKKFPRQDFKEFKP